LNRFLAAWPTLDEAERESAAKKISEAGLLPSGAGIVDAHVSEEYLRALGLTADQPLNLDRLVQLTAQLLDTLSRLDQTGLRTMEALAPRSSVLKRSESIRRSASRLLTGERENIDSQMRDVAGLMGALLAAVLGGGRVFGQQYVERFSPSAIEDVVRAEGGGRMFGPSMKERCWDRYVDLARDYATSDLVDRKIRECLASVVQRTIEKGNAVSR
jgi:hypothetical protein